MSIARTGISRTGLSAGSGRLPDPVAPDDLTVLIVESSLAFGDTATSQVSASGYPFPNFAYQWTIDGEDVPGQTGSSFEGVPAGALRLRVTATNSEGSTGPETSDPVTVSALLPAAFSAGQWAVDATGAIEEVDITLFGLPPANGAAITSVERAAGTQRRSFVSTWDVTDWSFVTVDPFVLYQSPWGMGDKEGGELRSWVTSGGLQGTKTFVLTNDMPLNAGLPAGAPSIILGAHYDLTSTDSPFVRDALRGFRTDEITELAARGSWTDRSTDETRSHLIAWQLYLSRVRTQAAGWNGEAADFFDVQVRPSPEAGTNFPAMTGTNSYSATLGGIAWNIVRTITTNQGADTRSYGFEPDSATVTEAPLKAILDWIVANEIANFAQSETYLWLYAVEQWVEPRSGVTDMILSDFAVDFNGATYESIPTPVALAGVDLDTAYAVTGLKDAERTDFAIRPVNSVGAGPWSEIKLETPFRSTLPTQLGASEWTFDAVLSTNYLNLGINRPITDEIGVRLRIGGVERAPALDADMATGPVNIGAPTITGTPALGEELTGHGGRWLSKDVAGVTGSTWRWLRDGVAIGGATATTYTLVEADNNTEISFEETATDANGSRAKVSDPTQTELTIEVTIRTGDYAVIELADYFPAEFEIDSGTLPTGLAFMDEVGIIYGVPTTAGVSVLSLIATGDITIPFTLTITVEDVAAAYSVAEFDGASVIYVGTFPGGSGGSGTPSPIADSTSFSMFFDVNVPASIADSCIWSNGSRHRISILSTGAVQVELDDTGGAYLCNITTNLGGGATDIRNGRHRIGVTVNTTGTATAVVTVDGVAQALTTSTLTTGTLDHTHMPIVMGARQGATADRIIPADLGVYQVAIWTDRLIDWTVAGGPGFDADAYGGAMIIYGGASANWTTPTIRGATSAASYAVSGTNPTVSAVYGEDPTPRAFAGTKGFGRYTTGGLGETLYRVTNLSTSAATSGSLPWAVAQATANDGGYILVEAEGPLELADRLFVEGDNITIDFRRSPGLGFWLNNASMWVTGSNIVLRHPRFLPGSNFAGQNPTGRDGLIVGPRVDDGAVSRIYIERPTVMFSLDEGLSVYAYKAGSTISDVTIDGAFIAEPCHANIHGDELPPTGTGIVDNHGKGLIIGASNGALSRVTVIDSLLATGDDRMPRVVDATGVEFINCAFVNYGGAGIQVTASSLADFVNCLFLLGDKPGNPTTTSSKWVQATTSTTLEAVYETGCFTGAWTSGGGFDGAAMIDNWRNQTDNMTFMDASALDNPHLFTKSGAHSDALSYADFWAAMPDLVGSLSASDELFPHQTRVLNYIDAATPFTAAAGNYGTNFTDDMIPDEVQAVGITLASGGAGALTVTLLAANTSLPPVSDRPWASVSVTVVNAYTDEIVVDEVKPPRTANTWADGVSQAGLLAGGAVAFTGLPPGFYVARVIYEATKADGVVPVPLYTGRPVTVA